MYALCVDSPNYCGPQAEPALNVLGETVETLSQGKFTKKMLIYAVCVGVAAGMCAGADDQHCCCAYVHCGCA
jgi:hypothetical protein